MDRPRRSTTSSYVDPPVWSRSKFENLSVGDVAAFKFVADSRTGAYHAFVVYRERPDRTRVYDQNGCRTLLMQQMRDIEASVGGRVMYSTVWPCVGNDIYIPHSCLTYVGKFLHLVNHGTPEQRENILRNGFVGKIDR